MTAPKPEQIPLSDSDWSKRHNAISYRRLMYLEKHETRPDTFTSTSAAYPPTAVPRTYGGHVFAQSAWAASHTVALGLHVNSITGYFLLLGDTRFAFEYRVKRVRDGGVYALRQVEAYQNSKAAEHGNAPVFVCHVSFKRDERGKHKAGTKGQRKDFAHQEVPSKYLQEEYGDVLKRKERNGDWPLCQGMDGMWPAPGSAETPSSGGMDVRAWKQRGDAFPGLEMRKVDMKGYNSPAVECALEDGGEAARRWRLLTLYRLVVDENEEKEVLKSLRSKDRRKTGADDQLNVHICAHLYASDRNSLFLAQRALGFHNTRGQIGSLSHTVNIHAHASDCRMVDETTGVVKWYAQEAWTSNSGGDRVCHNSRVWDLTTGTVLMTTVQDGMMRIPVDGNIEIMDGDAIMTREAKL